MAPAAVRSVLGVPGTHAQRMHLEGPVPHMRSRSETAATVRTAALVPALVAILIAALLLSLSLARPRETAQAVSGATGHIVVLAGVTGADGSFQVGGNDALNLAAARQLVTASGATIQADLADRSAAFSCLLRPTSPLLSAPQASWRRSPRTSAGRHSHRTTRRWPVAS